MKRFLFIILLLLFASPLWATDYYVNPDVGSSGNGLSWATGWKAFSNINWTTLNTGTNTLYFSGSTISRTYSGTLTIEHTGSGVLTIRPGSASPSPSGHSGLVTILPSAGNGAIYFENSINLVISGETTVGAGTRNMKLLQNGYSSIYNNDRGSNTNINTKILYLQFTRAGSPTGNTESHALAIGQSSIGFEFAYNWVHHIDGSGVDQRWVAGAITGYGQVASVHHNIFEDSYQEAWIYTDWGGGWDIYNNVFARGMSAGGSHADSIQGGMRYLRIFNNIFHDITSGHVFIESTDGGTIDHLRIYNNIFYDSNWGNGTEPAVNIKWGSNNSNTMNDVYIVNNTFYKVSMVAVWFQNDAGGWKVTNSVVENNIFVGTGDGANIWLPAGTYSNTDLKIYRNTFDTFGAEWKGTYYSNLATYNTLVGATGGNANKNCTPSFTNGATWDVTLQSGDTCAKDQGLNLSSLTNMGTGWPEDKNNISRPQGSAWDIGAYEYEGGTIPSSVQGLTIQGGTLK